MNNTIYFNDISTIWFYFEIIERYTIVQKKFQVLLKINAVRNRSCSSHPIPSIGLIRN